MRTSRKTAVLALLATAAASAFTAPRIDSRLKPVIVTWSIVGVSAQKKSPHAGAVVHVRANVANGWHVYALTQTQGGPHPLSFALEQAPGFSLGAPSGPTPQRAMDAEFGIQTETYSGAPEFALPVSWQGSRPRETELRLVIRFQACSDRLCLPPLKEELRVNLSALRT